jgi:hypothetical protein
MRILTLSESEPDGGEQTMPRAATGRYRKLSKTIRFIGLPSRFPFSVLLRCY